jgi:hypothetical protein
VSQRLMNRQPLHLREGDAALGELESAYSSATFSASLNSGLSA